MLQTFDVVYLEPLPAHLVMDGIELAVDDHWTISFEYIFNRAMMGMKGDQYVIGFTNKARPVETTAIVIDGRYFSPVVNEKMPFMIMQAVDQRELLNFFDIHLRPCYLKDFDTNTTQVA